MTAGFHQTLTCHVREYQCYGFLRRDLKSPTRKFDVGFDGRADFVGLSGNSLAPPRTGATFDREKVLTARRRETRLARTSLVSGKR